MLLLVHPVASLFSTQAAEMTHTITSASTIVSSESCTLYVEVCLTPMQRTLAMTVNILFRTSLHLSCLQCHKLDGVSVRLVFSGADGRGHVMVTERWCASGCVVECRICNWEVAGLNLGLGYFAPRSTQPSIPPGSVNEYQL